MHSRVPAKLLPIFRSYKLLLNALALIPCLSLASMSTAQTYIKFDPQGSQLTYVTGMNAQGEVVGTYSEGPDTSGFVRSADGTFTIFGPPGDGTSYISSSAAGINREGTVIGYYAIPPLNHNPTFLPFVRKEDVKTSTIDIPKSCVKPLTCFGNQALGVNDSGTVIGQYQDENHALGAFILRSDGKLTEFKAPEETAGLNFGTYPTAINNRGEIIGFFNSSSSGTFKAFVRSTDGEFTTFSASGAGTGENRGTFPSGINNDGTIAGYYVTNKDTYGGFLRTTDGKITEINAPKGVLVPSAINSSGTVVGSYFENNSSVSRGFLRTAEGKITFFDFPGTWSQSDDYEGTFPVSINDAGVVAGYFTDNDGVLHGFIRKP